MIYIVNCLRWNKGTYVVALRHWDVNYCWKTCLQLNALVIPSVRQVNERAAGPLEKVQSRWRIVCIVVVAWE
jgi:hypothetical protein